MKSRAPEKDFGSGAHLLNASHSVSRATASPLKIKHRQSLLTSIPHDWARAFGGAARMRKPVHAHGAVPAAAPARMPYARASVPAPCFHACI
eukprot:1607806-Pleurochrysis_carterae.AAC.2